MTFHLKGNAPKQISSSPPARNTNQSSKQSVSRPLTKEEPKHTPTWFLKSEQWQQQHQITVLEHCHLFLDEKIDFILQGVCVKNDSSSAIEWLRKHIKKNPVLVQPLDCFINGHTISHPKTSSNKSCIFKMFEHHFQTSKPVRLLQRGSKLVPRGHEFNDLPKCIIIIKHTISWTMVACGYSGLHKALVMKLQTHRLVCLEYPWPQQGSTKDPRHKRMWQLFCCWR